jgi:hypothetical protein
MKIQFTDTFFKSLKKLSARQTWFYKAFDFFRDDMPNFFKNIWYFRKELYAFRSWDYSYNLDLFRRSLEKTVYYVEHKGYEIDESRLKKVEKMKRAIELMKNALNDNYIAIAQKELGELRNMDSIWTNKESTEEEIIHNKKVFERERELENAEWKELWSIIQGQDINEIKNKHKNDNPDLVDEMHSFNDWFDGSGMKNWWD